MSRTTLRIASWAALMASVLAALAAATTVVVGILVFAGRLTYPVDLELGPLSVQHEISMPVTWSADVCQLAGVRNPEDASDCLTFFAHDPSWSGHDPVRIQDASIRPMRADLTGTVGLATSSGGNSFVAASVARTVIGLISAVLLLWRLLRSARARALPLTRAIGYVRTIGWLLIAGASPRPSWGRQPARPSWGTRSRRSAVGLT